jgi:hypothetical protein
MMLAPKVARSPAKPEARSKPGTGKPPSLSFHSLPAHASCTFDENSLQLLPNGTATTNIIDLYSQNMLADSRRAQGSMLAAIFGQTRRQKTNRGCITV